MKRTLYHGDHIDVMSLEYRMDDEQFRKTNVLGQTVEVTVHAEGMKPLRLSKRVSELNSF